MRLIIYTLMGATLWSGFAQADNKRDRNNNRPAQRDSKPTRNDSRPTRNDSRNDSRPNNYNRNDTKPVQRNDSRNDSRPNTYNRNDNRPTNTYNRNDRNDRNDSRPNNYNRNDNRPNNAYNRNDNRPNNTYNRNDNRPNNYRGDRVRVTNRSNTHYTRNGRTVTRVDKQYRRARYTGPVRANRVAVTRTKLYHSNGVFRFHGGHTVVYRAPVITQRYYNYNIRPTLIVENYPAQYGYIWVNGSWNWNGSEWLWTGGYYAPDPAIGTYYDDGSYDVADEYLDDADLDIGEDY